MADQIETYSFTNGWTMIREGDARQWHLRRADGTLVEKDRYRHDLIERHDLEILEHIDPVWEKFHGKA